MGCWPEDKRQTGSHSTTPSQPRTIASANDVQRATPYGVNNVATAQPARTSSRFLVGAHAVLTTTAPNPSSQPP